MKLHKKTILITGANKGIGRALAQEAAKNKMNIHCLYRSQAHSLREELFSLGAQSVTLWKVDLTKTNHIINFLDDFKKQNNTLDILINNAGQLTGGLLEKQNINSILSMLQVNLFAAIHLTQALIPLLLKSEQAYIVNNTSISAVIQTPLASTYAASKSGLLAFTNCLEQELSTTSIKTLSLITPGVNTKMLREVKTKYQQHLKLNLLSSMPPEQWAKKTFNCMKKNKSHCLPGGISFIGIKASQHFPSLMKKFIKNLYCRGGF